MRVISDLPPETCAAVGAASLSKVKAGGGRTAEAPWKPQQPVDPAWTFIMKHPFAVPTHLSPDLERVRAYWRGLLRGGAETPFWDDAKLSDLPDLTDRLLLIDVFQKPERFRLGSVGKDLGGEALAGCFLDETALGPPLEFLRAQSSATVECAAPTWFRFEGEDSGPASTYSRLLLPMWGDGRISMILAAVDFG
jgi:hypothetical protein